MAPDPDPRPVPLTKAGLARRYKVTRSAVTRRLQAAARAHQRNPTVQPPPPKPLDPEGQPPLFDVPSFDDFWRSGPPPGRPRTTGDTDVELHADRGHR